MRKLCKGTTGKVKEKEKEVSTEKWKQKDGILGEMTSRK